MIRSGRRAVVDKRGACVEKIQVEEHDDPLLVLRLAASAIKQD